MPTTVNGWYTHDGRVVWGNAHQNQWWGGYRGSPTGWWTDWDLSPSLVRRDRAGVGYNRTEDLGRLTDHMLAWGYPGFEHTPPLWSDRRRDAHDTVARTDADVVGPLLESPWARTDHGRAWDGLPLYDLTRFNPWYFDRLRAFAELCDRKGCVLLFHFYNQHNLLESQAHYCDYPWRPANCVQNTGLPDATPAANAFYDVTHATRAALHRQFVRHCLDVLGGFRNVVFFTAMEYTGPLAFVRFWMDTILEWERDVGQRVHIGLGATKDVADLVLADPHYGPRIGTVDLRYWYTNPDGTLTAPPGGQQVPGRYTAPGFATMTAEQVYRHVREYRDRYPDKALIRSGEADPIKTLAFLMAGGSMLVRHVAPLRAHPPTYDMPLGCEAILPAYEFIREHLAEALPRMRPLDILSGDGQHWCLGEPGESYLVFLPTGQQRFTIDLTDAPGAFDVRWVGLRLGTVIEPAGRYWGTPEEGKRRGYDGPIEGGRRVDLAGLDWRPWLLWLKRRR